MCWRVMKNLKADKTLAISKTKSSQVSRTSYSYFRNETSCRINHLNRLTKKHSTPLISSKSFRNIYLKVQSLIRATVLKVTSIKRLQAKRLSSRVRHLHKNSRNVGGLQHSQHSKMLLKWNFISSKATELELCFEFESWCILILSSV